MTRNDKFKEETGIGMIRKDRERDEKWIRKAREILNSVYVIQASGIETFLVLSTPKCVALF